jgi:glycosyltransferase involved in cell wall biosynthesis
MSDRDSDMSLIRVALVTNIPAPYRIPVYERLADKPGCALHLVYCSGSEPDRAWRLKAGQFDKTYLKQRFITFRGRFIHVNPDVWPTLRAMRPDVVITTGYNPTHLMAWAYALLHRVPHIVMTDGTLQSEADQSFMHRLIRRVVLAGSRAFVGPSNGSLALFHRYGVARARMFKSHLCANNAAYDSVQGTPKLYDLLFCGRMVAVKNPLFALDLACALSARLGRRVSLAYLGAGELEADVRQRAAALAHQVDVTFLGFAQQDELPARYAAAKLFLFPTSWDPWGVVANEACAAGLPVLVTPEAGCAGDLVTDGFNGRVIPLEMATWVDACAQLLTDAGAYARMSANARKAVEAFNFDEAAQGLWQAVCLAVGQPESGANG